MTADVRMEIKSTTDAAKQYIVSFKRGRWMCSCPAWIYRRKECKHIKLAQSGQVKSESVTVTKSERIGISPSVNRVYVFNE